MSLVAWDCLESMATANFSERKRGQVVIRTIKAPERSDFRPWTLVIPCWILDIQVF